MRRTAFNKAWEAGRYRTSATVVVRQAAGRTHVYRQELNAGRS